MTLDTLWTVLPLLALIFMASGTVKGLSGFGMPFIAVPGATILLNVPISVSANKSAPVFHFPSPPH